MDNELLRRLWRDERMKGFDRKSVAEELQAARSLGRALMEGQPLSDDAAAENDER